jgi:cytidylate kinase
VSAPLVVAIDGAAGTGKSTVARALARELGVPYLDTGSMYRAVALRALELGIPSEDRAAVAAMLPALRLEVRLAGDGHAEVLLDGEPVEARIRSAEVAAATSRLAVHPEVRDRMVQIQRGLARRHGGVIEGRDIGTRVVPETPFKFFLSAAPEVRARRRLGDLRAAGRADLDQAEVARDLAERDARDASRALSPLVPAPDAVWIDTSALSADEVIAELARRIRRQLSSPGG